MRGKYPTLCSAIKRTSLLRKDIRTSVSGELAEHTRKNRSGLLNAYERDLKAMNAPEVTGN